METDRVGRLIAQVRVYQEAVNLLTALHALRLLLLGKTGLGHPSSYQGSLLNRKQDRFWMGGQKRRGDLFRLEKEGLRTKDVSYTFAALGWQDQ